MKTQTQSNIFNAIRLIFFAAVPGLYLIASGRKFAGFTIIFIPGTLALFASIIEFEKDLFYFEYMNIATVLFMAIYTFNIGVLVLDFREICSQPINLIQILFGLFFLFASYFPINSSADALDRVFFTNNELCPYFCSGDSIVYSVLADPTQIKLQSVVVLENGHNDHFVTFAFVVDLPGDTICEDGHWNYFPVDRSVNCWEMITLSKGLYRVAVLENGVGVTSIVAEDEILGHAPVVVGNVPKSFAQLKTWTIEQLMARGWE
jgi:hypothetical protein